MSALDIAVCILIVLAFTALMAAIIVAADLFKAENLEKYRKAYLEKFEKSQDTEALK